MTEKEKRRQPFRVNATLSEEHSNYLDEKSKEMGVSKSALVSIAVNDWIQGERNKDAFHERLIKEHIQKLEEEAREKVDN